MTSQSILESKKQNYMARKQIKTLLMHLSKHKSNYIIKLYWMWDANPTALAKNWLIFKQRSYLMYSNLISMLKNWLMVMGLLKIPITFPGIHQKWTTGLSLKHFKKYADVENLRELKWTMTKMEYTDVSRVGKIDVLVWRALILTGYVQTVGNCKCNVRWRSACQVGIANAMSNEDLHAKSLQCMWTKN